MNRSQTLPLLLVLILVGQVWPVAASHARPQDAAGGAEADLRTENERLRTRVQDLERELGAARRRIAALEAQLKGGSGGGAAPGAASPDPAGTSAAPSAPAASPTDNPAALLAELQQDYATTFADTTSFAASERDRTMYLRAVERWVAVANRRYRARIEWPVRVLPDTLRPFERGRERGGLLTLQAVDPGTGAAIGEAFDTFLPAAALKRFDQERLRRADAEWRLRGTLIPAVQLNAGRTEVGAFDRPRFIGPFAEFGFGVDAISLTEAREAESTKPAPAAPPAAGSTGTAGGS